jgi:nucleoside phosphorylase
MKILIVDDSVAKTVEIDKVLQSTLSGRTLEIEHSKSFVSAIKKLGDHFFDLVILDLVLPIRDNDVPVAEGGAQILAEIVEGVSCKRPTHIICLTAFEEIAKVQQLTEGTRCIAHTLIYTYEDNSWRDALKQKVEYLISGINAADAAPKGYLIDIAIVTSSPQVELKAVTALPGSLDGEFNHQDAMHYYKAEWQNSSGKGLKVIACAAPTMGMTAACATALKVIHRWRPKYLVMTGIAAGVKGKVALGDVLAAEASFDYGSGKIVSKGKKTLSFIPSPLQLRLDSKVHAILQKCEREQAYMSKIAEIRPLQPPRVPKLHLGIMASGAAVVQSRDHIEEILKNSRKVIGVDMECYAMFHAAHLSSEPRPKVIVAKSISDFADFNKSDKFQEYAAFTSARFIYELMTQCNEM